MAKSIAAEPSVASAGEDDHSIGSRSECLVDFSEIRICLGWVEPHLLPEQRLAGQWPGGVDWYSWGSVARCFAGGPNLRIDNDSYERFGSSNRCLRSPNEDRPTKIAVIAIALYYEF